MEDDRRRKNDFLRQHGYTWHKETDYSYMDDDDNFPLKQWVLRGQDGKEVSDIEKLLRQTGFYGDDKARREADAVMIKSFFDSGRRQADTSHDPDNVAGDYFNFNNDYDTKYVISQDALWEISKFFDSGDVAYKHPHDQQIAEAMRRTLEFNANQTLQHNTTKSNDN